MLVTQCPACGSPAPASLATPDVLVCNACGHSGPPGEGIEAKLRGAASVLEGLDVRRRQLSRIQRRGVESGAYATVAFLVVVGVVSCPFSCFAFVGLLSMSGRTVESVFDYMFFGLPFLILILFSGIGLVWIRRARRSAIEAFAAIPPPGPDEPARCHACGGPLTAGVGEAFVRCAFCSADNLVSHPLLARLTARRADVLDDFAQGVSEHVELLRKTGRRAIVGVFLVAFAAPIVGFTLSCCVFIGLSEIEAEPTDAMEYALVRTSAGRCIAAVGPSYLTFGIYTTDQLGLADTFVPRPEGEIETFGWSDLVGLHVVDSEWGAAQVVRVHGSPGLRDNHATCIDADGAQFQRVLEDLCFDEGAPAPAGVVMTL